MDNSTLSFFATLLATIVALFKDELRGIFIHPKLKIVSSKKLTEKQSKDTASIQALEYFYSVKILNSGNIPAQNVRVYLEHCSYLDLNSQKPNEVEVDGIQLPWQESDNKQILLPKNSKKRVVLFSVIKADTQSTPEQNLSESDNQPKIVFGIHQIPANKSQRTWTLKYAVYSDNAKTIYIDLSVKWNGKWESRWTEMEAHLSVEEVIRRG